MILIPCLMLVLLRYVFDGSARTFDSIGASLLRCPLITMFLVTSIATCTAAGRPGTPRRRSPRGADLVARLAWPSAPSPSSSRPWPRASRSGSSASTSRAPLAPAARGPPRRPARHGARPLRLSLRGLDPGGPVHAGGDLPPAPPLRPLHGPLHHAPRPRSPLRRPAPMSYAVDGMNEVLERTDMTTNFVRDAFVVGGLRPPGPGPGRGNPEAPHRMTRPRRRRMGAGRSPRPGARGTARQAPTAPQPKHPPGVGLHGNGAPPSAQRTPHPPDPQVRG